MVSEKALDYFNEKVRSIAAALGLPATQENIEVLRDEGSLRTAYVQFYEPYEEEDGQRVIAEFVKDGQLADTGLWGDEYALGTEQEPWEGCEAQYYFDVSAIDHPEFVEATDAERAEWRRDNYLFPRNPKRPARNVFLPMKFKYFDDIAAGRKTVECRQYVQKWVDGLFTNNLRYVTFQRGYEKGARQMTFEIAKVELADHDERHRYPIEEIPDLADPEWILIHLGKRTV